VSLTGLAGEHLVHTQPVTFPTVSLFHAAAAVSTYAAETLTPLRFQPRVSAIWCVPRQPADSARQPFY